MAKASADRLIAIMRALRDPVSGCSWDLDQDFASIAHYTIEEAYEVQDAIDRQDWQDLREELGDLLLQVVFHAQIASDKGLFGFGDVVQSICDKMVRRHPHVFGAARQSDPSALREHWEADKALARAKKAQLSALDGVAGALPALTRALKLTERAGRVGFDWKDAARVWDKVDEELGELKEAAGSGDPDRIEDELGDVLFVIANLARHYGVDPEVALKRTNQKFVRRFQGVEARLAQAGQRIEQTSLDEMDRHWTDIKKAERGG